MTEDNPKPKSRRALDPVVSRLNALDLALQSQQLELEGQALVRTLLPLLDHIESICRGFDHLPPERQQARAEAVATLAEVADTTAGRMQLEPIGKVGERSDPDRHEVVGTRAAPGAAHGSILEVTRRGWSYQGRVLRPAQVIAAIPSEAGGTK